MDSNTVVRSSTSYTAQDGDPSIRAYRDEIAASIGQNNIVDVRSPAEFAGDILAPAHFPQEQPQVPGHVPTAVNVPWSKAAADDGSFLPDEELRALYSCSTSYSTSRT
jgi:thiosulfate/3-mercaptopyruvate sulfurtransferase